GDPFEDAGPQSRGSLATAGLLQPVGEEGGDAPPGRTGRVVLQGQVDGRLSELLLLGGTAPPRGHRFTAVHVPGGERVAVAEDDAVDAFRVVMQAHAARLPGVQVARAGRGTSGGAGP